MPRFSFRRPRSCRGPRQCSTIPAEHGSVRTLTTSTQHPRTDPALARRKSIAYLSDKSGEYELTRGLKWGEETRITMDGKPTAWPDLVS